MNAITPVGAAGTPRVTLGYDETKATFDALTGELVVSDAAMAGGFSVNLTTLDTSGQPVSVYRLSSEFVGTLPRAVGVIANVALSRGAADTLVQAAPYFTGTGLVFTLENAPANVTINATTGAITITAQSSLATTQVSVKATNAAGAAVQSFTVTVTASTLLTLDLAAPAATADVTFLADVAPAWTNVSGAFARLVPATTAIAHGNWRAGQGDGLYRILTRWSGATLAASVDRKFFFGARVGKTGSDWRGIRVETFVTSSGLRRLHIREYTGILNATRPLATLTVGWDYDTWYWLDVNIVGATIDARLYPETSLAPDWQIRATTTNLLPGAAGPGGIAALGQSPEIDVRRLEFSPVA